MARKKKAGITSEKKRPIESYQHGMRERGCVSIDVRVLNKEQLHETRLFPFL